MKYFLDWAHKTDKQIMVDEKGKQKPISKIKDGDEIYTENAPYRYVREWVERNATVYRCPSHAVADFRKANGLEKTTDLDDALHIKTIYKKSPELFIQWEGDPPLMNYYSLYKKAVKERVAIGNQIWAIGEDEGTEISDISEAMKKNESKIEKKVKAEVKKYKIYTEYLAHIKGIAHLTGGGIIGVIDRKGIENFPSCGKLKAYLGIHVGKDGLAPKRRKKENLGFSMKNKTLLLGDVASSLIRSKSPYKTIFDKEKARLSKIKFRKGELLKKYGAESYKKEDTKRTKKHVERMARRKMMQIFVNHLWTVWRKLEGLSTRSPYSHEKLGHSQYFMPFVIPKSLEPFKPF